MSERPERTGHGYQAPGSARKSAAALANRTTKVIGEGAAAAPEKGPRRTGADAVWRATVDQRLTGVEDAIGDLRTRVNSVLALIGAAVVGQIALRFFGH